MPGDEEREELLDEVARLFHGFYPKEREKIAALLKEHDAPFMRVMAQTIHDLRFAHDIPGDGTHARYGARVRAACLLMSDRLVNALGLSDCTEEKIAAAVDALRAAPAPEREEGGSGGN